MGHEWVSRERSVVTARTVVARVVVATLVATRPFKYSTYFRLNVPKSAAN
jgi:hypothetical protein